MKHLQKFTWLGGLLIATSGLVASPAQASDLEVTGGLSMSGKLPIKKDMKIKNLQEIGLPLSPKAHLKFQKTFELEEGDIDGVVKLNMLSEEKGKETSIAPQIMIAYFDYGMFRMGIAESLLGDKHSLPTMLSSKEGAVQPGQPQFRWSFESDNGLSYALAFQTTWEKKEKKADLKFPDVVGSMKYAFDETSYLRGALKLNATEHFTNKKADVAFSGKWDMLPEMLSGVFQAGVPMTFSGITTAKLKQELKDEFSFLLGLEYKAIPELATTLVYNIDGKSSATFGKGGLNLVYDITKNLSVGGEYLCESLKNLTKMDEGKHSFSTVVKLTL